jgi:serine protease Do
MKKILFSTLALCFMAWGSIAFAQDEKSQDQKIKDEKKMQEKINQKEKERMRQSQEIVIRKSGDKDTKITVEVNGDKVTINGKPLSEFKDDNVTVNKRYITVLDNKGNKKMEFLPEDFANGFSYSTNDDMNHGFLGVTTESKENDKEAGAVITDITAESAAEKAGLKTGDIIFKVDDRKIENPQDLTDAIGSKKPKDEVTVYYKRDDKENSVKATLGARKNAMTYSFTAPNGIARSYSYSMPRVNVAPRIQNVPGWNEEGNMMPRIATPFGEDNFEVFGDMYPRHQKLGIKIQDTEDGKGVKVLDVEKDSPAEKAGLKKDDIVTEVAGNKVSNTDEAREQLQENAEKASYNVKAKRNGNEMSFDIKIPKKLKTANL